MRNCLDIDIDTRDFSTENQNKSNEKSIYLTRKIKGYGSQRFDASNIILKTDIWHGSHSSMHGALALRRSYTDNNNNFVYIRVKYIVYFWGKLKWKLNWELASWNNAKFSTKPRLLEILVSQTLSTNVSTSLFFSSFASWEFFVITNRISSLRELLHFRNSIISISLVALHFWIPVLPKIYRSSFYGTFSSFQLLLLNFLVLYKATSLICKAYLALGSSYYKLQNSQSRSAPFQIVIWVEKRKKKNEDASLFWVRRHSDFTETHCQTLP